MLPSSSRISLAHHFSRISLPFTTFLPYNYWIFIASSLEVGRLLVFLMPGPPLFMFISSYEYSLEIYKSDLQTELSTLHINYEPVSPWSLWVSNLSSGLLPIRPPLGLYVFSVPRPLGSFYLFLFLLWRPLRELWFTSLFLDSSLLLFRFLFLPQRGRPVPLLLLYLSHFVIMLPFPVSIVIFPLPFLDFVLSPLVVFSRNL